MKISVILIPFLFLIGCGVVAGRSPDGTEFFATTLLKDPDLGLLHYTPPSATTQGSFDVQGYKSVSRTELIQALLKALVVP